MKNPNPKETNGLDPFSEDDDDVKRIAAEMEAKYVNYYCLYFSLYTSIYP